MDNPFAQELASRQLAQPQSSDGPQSAPGNPFAAELSKRTALGALDFSKPDDQVRADIGNLAPEYHDEALNAWAQTSAQRDRQRLGSLAPLPSRIPIISSLGEQIDAGANQAIHSASGGKYGRPYDESLAFERAQGDEAQKAHPAIGTAVSLAGGAVLPVPPVAQAATGLGRIGQGVATGAAYGGIAGAADTRGNLPDRAEGAVAGGAVGALAGGAISGVANKLGQWWAQRSLANETSKYFDATSGQLTAQGEAAAKAIGADPAQMVDSAKKVFASTYAANPQEAQSMLGSGRLDFDIPQTLGQRTKDGEQLMAEKAMRAGLNGDVAKGIITNLDADQAAKVAQAARDTIPTRMMQAGPSGQPFQPLQANIPFSQAEAGQSIGGGLNAAKAAANANEDAAWGAVGRLDPSPEARAALGPKIDASLGPFEVDDALHPVAAKTLKMLDDYAAGRPVGVRNPNPDVDTMRRRIKGMLDDAVTPTDKKITGNIYGAYNDWIGESAANKMLAGDPESAAKLIAARDVTKTMHSIFDPKTLGKSTPGGSILQSVLKQDTPENIVTALFNGPNAGIKNGSIEALQNIRQALSSYADKDTAAQTWSAMKVAYWSKLVQGKDGELMTPLMQLKNIKSAMTSQRSLLGELYQPQDMDLMRRYAAQLEQIVWKDPNPSGTATGLASLTKQMFGKVVDALGPVGKLAAHMPVIPDMYGKYVANQAVRQTAPAIASQQMPPQMAAGPRVAAALGANAGMRLAPDSRRGMGMTPLRGH